MRVRFTTQMTGSFNDHPWPSVGSEIDVDDNIGSKLCAVGVATTLHGDSVGVHSSCADLAAAVRHLIAVGDLPAADALIRRTVHHYAHPVVDFFTEITRLEPL